MKHVSTSLAPVVFQKIQRIATKEKRTVAEVLRNLVDDGLAKSAKSTSVSESTETDVPGHIIVRMTMPNGTKAHYTVDGEKLTDDEVAEQMKTWVATARENDPEPIEGTAGVAATEQPLKQAVGERK